MAHQKDFSMEVTVNEEQVERLKTMLPMVALDPGGTIGVAVFRAETEPKAFKAFNLKITTLSVGWFEGAPELERLLVLAATVAYESFAVFPETSAQGPIDQSTLLPVEVRGYIKGSLVRLAPPVRELLKVTPASAKGMWKDEALRGKLGGLPSSPHQRDALRVGFYVLVRRMLS